VDDDIILMSDFNQGLSFNAALRRLHQLDDQGLEWFEEPIVFDDFANSARLANELKTPLQIGENIYGPRHFLQAVAAGAADCCMPDLERIGGVTGWLRSAAIAHLMRVTETADWLEWRNWGNPLLVEPFEVRGSAIHIPDRPGAGIAWDEAAVKRFAIYNN
jgi:mandelate racemase